MSDLRKRQPDGSYADVAPPEHPERAAALSSWYLKDKAGVDVRLAALEQQVATLRAEIAILKAGRT